jgi:hypothetical protein
MSRTAVQSQPGQIVCKLLCQKNTSQKRAGGVVQDIGPEFKPKYGKKIKKDSGSNENIGRKTFCYFLFNLCYFIFILEKLYPKFEFRGIFMLKNGAKF